MSIAKLFVYGTLLRGEVRSPHLAECALIKAASVSGSLYDTKRGYPAALFDARGEPQILGELYDLSTAPNLQEKLGELDEAEGVEGGLYKRVELNLGGVRAFAYEAGEALRAALADETRIESGDWRLYGSSALEDPIGFVNRFEAAQRRGYRKFPSDGFHEPIFLRGRIPILIAAPHATAHMRMGELKSEERHTAALAALLHITEGCHALYTNSASEIDPNYSDDSPFKRALAEVAREFGIVAVFDLHGTTQERAEGIYPGVGQGGEFLRGRGFILNALYEAASQMGISVGGLHVFPASRQMTVTKFASRGLHTSAMQIEINKRLREPARDPAQFETLVALLRRFVSSLGF
ncbi:MAG: gamma-glutamylcyclotransferase family protein [Deltaproteobacteria bacterium]